MFLFETHSKASCKCPSYIYGAIWGFLEAFSKSSSHIL
jgi:hypothetical protein